MKVVAPALVVLLLSVATLQIFTGTVHLTKTATARTAAMEELMSRSVALSYEIDGLEGDDAEKGAQFRALLARFGATLRDEVDSDNGADVTVELPLGAADGMARTRYRGIVRLAGSSIVGMRLVVERKGGP